VLEGALTAVDDHAGQIEITVVVLADRVVCVEQLQDALKREEARLRDNDQPRHGRQGIDREQAEST